MSHPPEDITAPATTRPPHPDTADSAARRRPSPGRGDPRPGHPFAWARTPTSVVTWMIRTARTAPLTLAFIAVFWSVGLALRVIPGLHSAAVASALVTGPDTLAAGRWWTVVTSAIWCVDLRGYVITTALLLALMAPAEKRCGALRVGMLAVVVQVVGTLLTAGLVLVTAWAGDGWTQQLAGAITTGPGPLAVGVGMAFTVQLGALWRRRLRLVIALTVLVLAAYSGTLHDVQRMVLALVGLLVGAWVLGRPTRSGHIVWVSSWVERRILIATIVVGSAIGPIVAAVSDTPVGPLAVLRYLFLTSAPDITAVQGVCADPSAADDCSSLLLQVRLSGIGPALMALVPVVLLLIAADGLRRGRRSAWVAAVAINLILVGLGALLATELFGPPSEQRVVFGGLLGSRTLLAVLLPLAVPLVIAGVLWWNRQVFDVGIPAGHTRRLTVLILASFAVLSVLFVGIGSALRDQFDHPASLGQLLLDLPSRFVPPGYLGEVPQQLLPTGTGTTLLYELTGVLFYAFLAAALVMSFRASDTGAAGFSARRQALQICRNQGGSSLSYLTTWPGNSYLFSPDHRAYLAYRVVGSVAVSVTGPVGAPDRHDDVLTRFATWCTENGMTPCLYSVGTPTRDAASRAFGWQAVQVAEETVLPLPGLAFTGKKWQDVRTALNKAAKAGVVAHWSRYVDASLSLRNQVNAISEDWVADKGLPEMGFTLGGVAELDDPNVRCLFAVDGTGRLHAVASFLPVARDGATVGWTLDFMRRRPDGIPGVMEFLIATAAREFQTDGAQFLSLSGAPLARVDREHDLDPVQRVLDTVGRALEPVYGFRSLLNFKAKFQPVYEPLWMLYPSALALPGIASAIGRCYLPHLQARQGARLLRRLTTHRSIGRAHRSAR